MFKTAIHRGIVIHGGRIYCVDIGSKRSNLAAIASHRIWLVAAEQPTRPHQDIGAKHMCSSDSSGPGHCLRGGRESPPSITIPLKGDNQGSIALAHNPVFHSRTKHIDIQPRYPCEEVAAKRIELSYVPTEQMVADGLTKALTHVRFHGFVEQMRMT